MWRWNKKTVNDGKLQLVEKEIYRALEPQNAEVETAATSPFFYRRLRAHIEAEARRRAEVGREWGAWLMTARQATPAFALVALLAVGVFWSAVERVNAPQPSVTGDVSVNLLATGDDSADELVAALADAERQDSNSTAAEPEKEQQ